MPRRILNIPPTTLAVIAIIACSVVSLYIIQEIERQLDIKQRQEMSNQRTTQLEIILNKVDGIANSLSHDRRIEHQQIISTLDNITNSLSHARQIEHQQIIDLINNLTNSLGNKTMN